MSNKGHRVYLVHCKGKTLRSVVLDNATDFPCTFIHATFPSFVPGFCLHAFKKSWEVSASLRPKQNNKPEDQSADLIIRNERKVTGSSRHFQLKGCMEGVLGLPSAMDSTSFNQSWKKWAVTVSTNQPREESRMGEWVCSSPSSLFLAFFFLAMPCGLWDVSSLTREGSNLCREAWSLNYWTTREVLPSSFWENTVISTGREEGTALGCPGLTAWLPWLSGAEWGLW